MITKKPTPEQVQLRFMKNYLKFAFERAQREMPWQVVRDEQEILADVCTQVITGTEALMDVCKDGINKLERMKHDR